MEDADQNDSTQYVQQLDRRNQFDLILNVNFGIQSVLNNTISSITGQSSITTVSRGSSGSGTSEAIKGTLYRASLRQVRSGAVVGIVSPASSVTTMTVSGNSIGRLSSTGASVTNAGIKLPAVPL